MKLLRSELNRGFHEELFDISVENIRDDDVLFSRKTVSCTLSSQTIPTGFKVFGILDIAFHLICDRCLKPYNSLVSQHYEVWLTPDKNIADEKSTDMIWFPDAMEEIDLEPFFHDFILLEAPYKKICSESCKGLCPHCGKDLNQGECSCEVTTGDSRWDVLKKLNKD